MKSPPAFSINLPAVESKTIAVKLAASQHQRDGPAVCVGIVETHPCSSYCCCCHCHRCMRSCWSCCRTQPRWYFRYHSQSRRCSYRCYHRCRIESSKCRHHRHRSRRSCCQTLANISTGIDLSPFQIQLTGSACGATTPSGATAVAISIVAAAESSV